LDSLKKNSLKVTLHTCRTNQILIEFTRAILIAKCIYIR